MDASVIEHPLDLAARLAGGRNVLAEKLGVSPSAIGNWKVRGVPFEHCVRIDAMTEGAVTRQMLRPHDWFEMWPELAEAQPQQAPAAITAVAGGEGGDA